MVIPNRRFAVLGVAVLATSFVLPGCATRKYVRLQTQALEPAIKEASNAAKENAERIDAVDKRAQQGIAAAAAADANATKANQAAAAAAKAAAAADANANKANQGVTAANTRITTLETRVSNINLSDAYTPGPPQTVTFAVNSSTLPAQARGALDKLATEVLALKTGYMIELQGFTDSTGSEQYNINLSQRRVQSVERYLVSKNVPLFRISNVGQGEDNPVADNKTRAGRDQNRRVEARVLRAAGR